MLTIMSTVDDLNSELKPVPYLAVDIDDFPAHRVTINGHADKVKKSAIFFPLIDRRAAASGDDMDNAVNQSSLIVMFMSREHSVHLVLCKKRFKPVPAFRILVETVVSMMPLPKVGIQGMMQKHKLMFLS